MSINNSSLGLGYNQNYNLYNIQQQQGLQQGPPPPPPPFLNGQGGQQGQFFQRFDNSQGIGFQGLNFGQQGQFGNNFNFQNQGFPGQSFGLFQGQQGLQGQNFGQFQGQQRFQLINGQGGPGGPGGQRPDPAQMFARLDANSDGTVTEEEFNNLPAPPNGRGPTAEMKEARWNQIDANQDGSVSEEEFVQAGPPPRPQLISNFQGRGFGLGTDSTSLQGTNGIDIQSLFSNLMSTFQSQLSAQ
jgi:hypothetical protein